MDLDRLLKRPSQRVSRGCESHSFCDGNIRFTDKEKVMYRAFGRLDRWAEEDKKERAALVGKITSALPADVARSLLSNISDIGVLRKLASGVSPQGGDSASW